MGEITAITGSGIRRTPATRGELTDMPELAAMFLRKSLGSVAGPRGRCSACQRTPLAGERLHEMDSGRLLCELCLAELPEADRRAVRSERVRASERRLPVEPRAA